MWGARARGQELWVGVIADYITNIDIEQCTQLAHEQDVQKYIHTNDQTPDSYSFNDFSQSFSLLARYLLLTSYGSFEGKCL